jgi:hypothetical protein
MSEPKAVVKWVSIVTTTVRDPRERNLPPGKLPREVVVADMIDELGRRWRQYDDEDPDYWGYAPDPSDGLD